MLIISDKIIWYYNNTSTGKIIDFVSWKDKCRGEKRALKKLIDHLKECGYTDGKIIIAHNNNEAGALELKKLIENTFGIFNGTIQKTRALCSYYAEPGSLLIGFEASLCNHKPYKD